MKLKSLVLIISLVTIVIPSHAQTLSNIGIKAGATFSRQDWELKAIPVEFDTKYVTGFYGAVNAELFRGKYFSMITDVAYSVKGHKEQATYINLDGTGGTFTNRFRFGFISISPQLKGRLESDDKLTPFAFVGPRADIHLSSRIKSNSGSHNMNTYNEILEPVVWGITYGAGVERKFKNIGISLEVQHQYDFTHLADTDITSDNAGLRIHTEAFAAVAGFKYHLGNKEKE